MRDPLGGASMAFPPSAIHKSAPLALFLCAILFGCGAGWRQPAVVTPSPLPARQQVQVWQHGTSLRWHAVRITDDSISGISYLRPLSCDTCRVSLPRAEVDSFRLGNPVAGFWKGIGLAGASIVVLGVAICWKGCGFE